MNTVFPVLLLVSAMAIPAPGYSSEMTVCNQDSFIYYDKLTDLVADKTQRIMASDEIDLARKAMQAGNDAECFRHFDKAEDIMSAK